METINEFINNSFQEDTIPEDYISLSEEELCGIVNMIKSSITVEDTPEDIIFKVEDALKGYDIDDVSNSLNKFFHYEEDGE